MHLQDLIGEDIQSVIGGDAEVAAILRHPVNEQVAEATTEDSAVVDDLITMDRLQVMEGFEPICEAKLFYTKNTVKRYDAVDMIDLIMICCILLFLFSQDQRFIGAASKYARKTISSDPSFGSWRSSGTDLYAAISIVKTGSNLRWMLKDETKFGLRTSEKVFTNTRLNLQELLIFLRNVEAQRLSDSFTAGYLRRLRRQLKVENTKIRKWLRTGVRWKHLTHRERAMLGAEMLQMVRQRFPTAELRGILYDFAQIRKYGTADKMPSQQKSSAFKDLVLKPAAGAAAGYALGKYWR